MEGPLNLIMKAVDEPTERNIIESLIHELNSKFNVGLDSNFSTSRCKDLSSLEEHMATDDYIVVGSSHAFRISSALTTLGEKVLCLASPYWRLNAENVESTAKSLEEAVKNNPGATVVFQLYDSSIYFSSLENGELVLPKRGEDGRYHIIGELVLAEWTALKKIFNLSAPLLRAAGKNLKIILSALPRYVQGRCCSDQLHLTNFGTKEYATEMGNSLAQIHSWLDDLAHGKRITEYMVMCVSSAIGLEDNPSKKELARIWGSDPVHLTPEGYSKLAEKITEKAVGRQNGPFEAASPIKATTTRVKTTMRKHGLSRSDLTASRWSQEAVQPGRSEPTQQTKPPSGGHQSGKRAHSGLGGQEASKKRY